MSSDPTDANVTPLFPVASSTEQNRTKPLSTPKFSSFRPVESATPSNLAELFSSDEESEDALSNTEALPHEKKRTRDDASLSRPSGSETKRHKKESHTDVYVVDKKGDRHNLLYQGLYRLDVPSYHRCSSATDTTHASRSMSTVLMERYFSPRFIQRERSKRLKRLKIDRVGCTDENDGRYIPLSSGTPEEHEGMINWPMRESIEEGVLRRTREFNIQLRKNPYDLSLWLRYADYQDEAVSLTRRRVTTSSTAEKKLSILASALKYHPKSEELLCQLLQLNAVVSSIAEANEKFQAMLSRLPHSLSLWRGYWSYLKSTFSEFSCEKMRGIYEGSLKGIETGLQTRASIVIQSEKAEEDVLLAFLCGVQFDFQSGYTEKGIAKIQACLEWVFCQPDNKDSLSEETLHIFFRQFWESVVPAKIGEEGAEGFAAFVRSKIIELNIPPLPSTPKAPIEEMQTTTMDPADNGWSGWFEIDSKVNEEPPEEEAFEVEEEELDNENQETETELMKELGLKLEELENVASISPEVLAKLLQTERQRMDAFFLPMKPDMEDEVDVDRLVLFEELQPLLFDVEHNSSKKKLLLGCLHLLGLDVSSLLCSNDHFFGGLGTCADGVPVQVSTMLRSILGEASTVCNKMLPWYQECRPCGRFVLHLLEFFSIQLFPSDIRIRHLWLKTAVEVEGMEHGGTIKATKVGRKILQKHQNDLNLWIAYASLLFEHGNIKESRRVWKAVLANAVQTVAIDPSFSLLSMVFRFLEGSELCTVQLALIAFLVTQDEAYLQSFLSGKDTIPMPLADMLDASCQCRCRDFFERKLNAALAEELTWSDYECIICYTHFQALVSFETPEAFCEETFYLKAAQCLESILYRLPKRFTSSSRQCEALYEKYHVWLSKARILPKDMKNAISRSLMIYPSNLFLLLLLVQEHVRAYTISTLLADVTSHVLKNPTTETVALLVLLEEFRSLQKVNTPGLFERLAAVRNGEHCASPLFWRLYLESVAKRRSSDFKRVFLRSIRACPWSKSIWMTGMECSQGYLKGNECVEYLETIKEKGVRWSTEAYEILLEEATEMEF